MKIIFDFSKGLTNYHGTQKKGEPWNRDTIHGPKLRYVKPSYVPPSSGHRLIYYFRDGSCWYFDIYFRRR